MEITPEQVELLKEARAKAVRLLDELLSHQAEFDANPPKIAPDQLEQGRHAMNNAVASARRMLQNLDEAFAIAGLQPGQDDDDDIAGNKR